MTGYILAIDQGTTNTKVSLVDENGAVRCECGVGVGIRYPQPAWVEQDAAELWATTQAAIEQTLADIPARRILAVAVTNQRESVLAWERASGKPLGPCITWQCQRGAPLIADLQRQPGLSELVAQHSGLALDAMFSAAKARWLLDHLPEGMRRAERGELCLGTVDSWLLWNLTGGAIHACDVTNASRTLLMNLERCAWDVDLLAAFGIPRPALPEILPSATVYGRTIACGSLLAGIPVAALIGDSHAALYGHAGFHPGAVKATYGTGSSLMTPTEAPVRSQHGLSATVAWGRERVTYALEGNIYATGAAVQWLAGLLGLDDPQRVEELAAQAPDADGVHLVPAFTGLGAPHWDAAARGVISGLTRGTSAGHLARATIESIAFQISDVFTAMRQEAGAGEGVLLADGGPTRNRLLMQFQADILGVPVLRSRVSDLSALGAAYLAGLAIHLWQDEAEIERLPRPHDRFEPQMSAAERGQRLAGWRAALARATLRPEA